MEIDKKIIDRMTNFHRRYDELLAKFIAAHKNVLGMAAHGNLAHLQVTIGDIKDDVSFDVKFADIRLKVRFSSELHESAKPMGRISFHECTGSLVLENRLASVSFDRRGIADVTVAGNDDEVDIEYWLFEIALMLVEKLLRSRSMGSIATTG